MLFEGGTYFFNTAQLIVTWALPQAVDAVPAEVRKCILTLPCFIRFYPHILCGIYAKGKLYDE